MSSKKEQELKQYACTKAEQEKISKEELQEAVLGILNKHAGEELGMSVQERESAAYAIVNFLYCAGLFDHDKAKD